MEQVTIQELENNFDEIFERVENGESFIIKTNDKDLALIPFTDYNKYYQEYFNHNDGP